ncbi:MAG: hypothetical protein KatS3mg003_1797 [Candidatus Nitrosocaldaceae archaeon]|nr:MAG: hypothetical protein KatS3mg003_1797 [Candidatus Nitrosocaldaceae archaeon]
MNSCINFVVLEYNDNNVNYDDIILVEDGIDAKMRVAYNHDIDIEIDDNLRIVID